jgi:hypothetical protein
VCRCLRGGHPSSGLLFGSVLGDRLTKKLILVRRGTPTAIDEELDPGARSIPCGLAEGTEEIWIKVGDGRKSVVEDRHAVRDDTVSLADHTIVVAVKTVVRAVPERLRGDG